MIDALTMRRAGQCPSPTTPAPGLCKVGGEPFTFRGHRLSSLYRKLMKTPNPFIFPKILEHHRVLPAERREYLEKGEGKAGARASQAWGTKWLT